MVGHAIREDWREELTAERLGFFAKIYPENGSFLPYLKLLQPLVFLANLNFIFGFRRMKDTSLHANCYILYTHPFNPLETTAKTLKVR